MKPGPVKLILLACNLLMALLLSLYFLSPAPKAFPVDDAYIHLCYAKNLAAGSGFAFNPREPGFGTSSPLWVLILAPWINWVEPHRLVFIISFLSLWMILYFSSLIISRTLEKTGTARLNRYLFSLIPSLFLVSFGNFLWIIYSGMETGLMLTLVLASVYFLIREKPAGPGYLLLGLAGLCRFETILLVPLVLSWQLFYLPAKKKIVFGILVSLLIPLAFQLWAYFRLGSFFPTTRAGKLASNLFNSGLSLKGGWIFLARHLHYLWITQPETIFAIALVLIGFTILISRKEFKFEIGPVEIVGASAILIFIYHDQFFRSTAMLTPYHNLRYQVLFFPALALGLTGIWTKLFRQTTAKPARVAATVILLFFLNLSFYRLRDWRQLYLGQSRHIQEVHQKTAEWTKANLPASARIACFDIGSLKFISERYVIDLGGLTDPGIDPYFKNKNLGEYLKKKNATHYIELGTPGSERMLGVRKDEGRLYQLAPLAYFSGQRIREPVLLHSWEMKIFEINWIGE